MNWTRWWGACDAVVGDWRDDVVFSQVVLQSLSLAVMNYCRRHKCSMFALHESYHI